MIKPRTCKLTWITFIFTIVSFLLSFTTTSFATSLGNNINIETAETLSSNTCFSDLPTSDSVNVYLNKDSYVTVMYNSSVVKTGCLGTMLSRLSIDSVEYKETTTMQGLNQNSSGLNIINFTLELPAGDHNFTVLHKVDGCTGYWLNRSLTILIHK